MRMDRELSILPLLALFILSSCAPYGHWGHYARWHHGCPDFPSLAEVERVLEEKNSIIEELQEEGLIWSADATKCPEGAFITLLHGGEWQKAPVLEILDEAGARAEGLNRFFGIPFRFLNV